MSSILPKQRGKSAFRLSWGDSSSRRASATTDTVNANVTNNNTNNNTNANFPSDSPPKYQFTADEIQGYPVLNRARNTIKRSSRVVSVPDTLSQPQGVSEPRRVVSQASNPQVSEPAYIQDDISSTAAALPPSAKRMKQPSQKSLNEDWISEILSDTESAKARGLSPQDALRIQEWLTRASSLPQRKGDPKQPNSVKTRKGQVVTEKSNPAKAGNAGKAGKFNTNGKPATLPADKKEHQDIRFPVTPMELSNFSGVYHPQFRAPAAARTNGREYVAPEYVAPVSDTNGKSVQNGQNAQNAQIFAQNGPQPIQQTGQQTGQPNVAAEREFTGGESPKSHSSGQSSTFESYYSVKTSADSATECSSLEILSVGVCEPLAISSSHESPVERRSADSSFDRSVQETVNGLGVTAGDANIGNTTGNANTGNAITSNTVVTGGAPADSAGFANEVTTDDARYRFEISLEDLLARSSSESLTIRSETEHKLAGYKQGEAEVKGVTETKQVAANDVAAREFNHKQVPQVPQVPVEASRSAGQNNNVAPSAPIAPAIAAKSVSVKENVQENFVQPPVNLSQSAGKTQPPNETEKPKQASPQAGQAAGPASFGSGAPSAAPSAAPTTTRTGSNSPTSTPAPGVVKQRQRPVSEFIPPPKRTSRPQSIASFDYCLDMGAEYDKSRFLIPTENQLSKHSSRNVGSSTASVDNHSSLNLASHFGKASATASQDVIPETATKSFQPEAGKGKVEPLNKSVHPATVNGAVTKPVTSGTSPKSPKPKKEVKLQEPATRERAPGSNSRPRPVSEFYTSSKTDRQDRPLSSASLPPFDYCLDLGAEYDKSRFMIPTEYQVAKPDPKYLRKTSHKRVASAPHMGDLRSLYVSSKDKPEGKSNSKEFRADKSSAKSTQAKPKESNSNKVNSSQVDVSKVKPRETAVTRPRPVSEFIPPTRPLSMVSSQSSDYCLDSGAEYDKSRFMIPTENQLGKISSPSSSRASLVIPPYVSKMDQPPLASSAAKAEKPAVAKSSAKAENVPRAEKPVARAAKPEQPVARAQAPIVASSFPNKEKPSARTEQPVQRAQQPVARNENPVSRAQVPVVASSAPKKAEPPVQTKPSKQVDVRPREAQVTRPRPVSEFIPPSRPLSMISVQSSDHCLDSGAEYDKSRFMIPVENQLGKTSSPSSSRASLVIPAYVSKMDQPPLAKAEKSVSSPVTKQVSKPATKPVSKQVEKPVATDQHRVEATPRPRPVSEFIPPTRPLSMISVQSSDYCLDSGAEYDKSRFMIPTENQLGKTSSSSSSRASLVIPAYVSKMDQPPLVKYAPKAENVEAKPVQKSAPVAAKPVQKSTPVEAKPVQKSAPVQKPVHTAQPVQSVQSPVKKPAQAIQSPVQKPTEKSVASPVSSPVRLHRRVEVKPIPKFVHVSSKLQNPVEIKPIPQFVPPSVASKSQKPLEKQPLANAAAAQASSKSHRPVDERIVEMKPLAQGVPPYASYRTEAPVEKKVERSEQRPVEKRPEQRPVEKRPEQRPVEKRPEQRPVEKRPEQRPLEKRPVAKGVPPYVSRMEQPAERKPVDPTPAPKGVPPYVSRMDQPPLSKAVPPYISLRSEKPVEKKPVSKAAPSHGSSYGPSQIPGDRRSVAKGVPPYVSSNSERPRQSVERPRESRQSVERHRESRQSVERPGESRQSVERPRESRQSVERPRESRQSVERPRESRQSVERPRESRQSVERPRESRQSVERPKDAATPRASVKLRRRPVSELIPATTHDLRPPQPQQKRPTSFYLDSSSYKPIVPETHQPATSQPGTPKARPKPISNFRGPKKQSPIKKLFSPIMKKRVHFSPSSADSRTAPGGARILTAH